MPRVLHIGKYFFPFPGGVENYLRDAMVALGRRGVECHALVHRHRPSLRAIDETLKVGNDALHVVRAGAWFRLVFTPVSPGFPLLLRRLVRRLRPDILHLHMPNPSAFWALGVGAARQIPWVVHWHSDVVPSAHAPGLRWLYRLYRPFERMVLKRAAAIIVTSRAYLEYSEPLRPFRHKCHVVPLGLDPAHAERAAAGQESAPDYAADPRCKVLAIGRLTYYKGFRFLIEAASRAPASLRVDIVGTGELAGALQSRITALGLEDRVRLLGGLTDAQLHALLRHCDAVCLPSIERTEAFGLVLLEAMLHAKPTIIADVPGSGMGWVVEQGQTGLKVEPGDPQGLAEALEWLCGHPAEAQAMGLRGAERFRQQFTIGQSVDGLLAVYSSIMEQPPVDKGATA